MHGGLARYRVLNETGDVPRRDPLVSRYLSISESEALFANRGFAVTSATPRLEAAGRAFISGYNFALATGDPDSILRNLASRPLHERGFAAEGAAMAAAMRTAFTPWNNRLRPVLEALAESFPHLAHVGVGWAIARLPLTRRWLVSMLDRRLLPLATDGQGFHDGYFHGAAPPGRRRPSGDWGSLYDQGLGRALWFIFGADPEGLGRFVSSQDPGRRGDLWAGIGLACVYAGGADISTLPMLCRKSGQAIRWLRQGAAFAVSAHARAGDVPEESAAAAMAICGMDAGTLIGLVEKEFTRSADGRQPQAYQAWRRRVADELDCLSSWGISDEPL